MATVLANFGGPSGRLASQGRSAIRCEKGELLARLERTGAGIAVAIDNATGRRAQAIMLVGL